VRNIIDWHLRSLWRDAEREGCSGPFPRLDWPRAHRAKPDPFDAEEREAILDWFAQHDSIPTGIRGCSFCSGPIPKSWARSLRPNRDSVISRRFAASDQCRSIAALRLLHGEIPVLPWVVDLLERLPRQLHSDGKEFLFLTPEGKPMTTRGGPSGELRGIRRTKIRRASGSGV
jgi:hypothetical protein